MKLSIIICLYNTKREYVKKCLSSITKSTLSKEDYEILVIDDGSTEDYSQLIEYYKPTYVKTENRGHLASRLYGLMIAKGDYVAFCDSDDTVSVNYHAPMLKKAIEENCGIVINDWAFHSKNGKAYPKEDITIKNDITLENEDILNYLTNAQGKYHSLFVLWNKVYKKSVLLSAKRDLEKTDAIMERMGYSEDALLNFFAYKNAKKLSNIHTGYYFYRIHDEQSTLVADCEKRLESQIKSMAKTINTMKQNATKDQKTGIDEWGKLMSRVQYTTAKSLELPQLESVIKEAYLVDCLEISRPCDEVGYIANGLLGDSFDVVDGMLYDISKRSGEVSVNYDKKDTYVASVIDYMNTQMGKNIKLDKKADISIPKRKVSLTQKLFHSKLAYSVGLRLFKKGSKIRRKLKAKL